jgi:hypothetical protein
MLSQVVTELKNAESGVNLNELSRKLGIERSALQGMIAYLVLKGKLQDDEKAYEMALGLCDTGSCGGSCPGPQGCPFVMKIPRTFSLPVRDETSLGTGRSQNDGAMVG